MRGYRALSSYHLYCGGMRNAREAYPSFLSLPQSIVLQLSYLSHGLLDANRWNIVYTAVRSDQEIRLNLFNTLLLNGLAVASLYIIDLPLLWISPVLAAGLYLNNTWSSRIASRAYSLRHGPRRAPPPSTYSAILTALASNAYRTIMLGAAIAVAFALPYAPVVGPPLGFALFSWLNAYYCFESIWIARGLSLAQRVRHLEERWAYYFAFGFPSSILCMWGGTLANAAIFALVLPLYIIMATHARPVPTSPYNPTFTAHDTFAMKDYSPNPTRSGNINLPSPNAYAYSAGTDGRVIGSSEFEFFSRHELIKQEIDMDMEAEGEGEREIRYPSPFVPIRLPVFTPVLWMMDRVVTVTVGKGRGKGAGVAAASTSATYGGPGLRRNEKGREMGEAGQRLGGNNGSVPSVYTPAAGGSASVNVNVNTAKRVRVSVGRRKVD